MNRFAGLVAAVAFLVHGAVGAGEGPYVSEPLRAGMQKVSTAADPRLYRLDAARHVYASYAPRIFKGRLPPLIHAVVVVESTVDSSGRVSDVKVVRGPSHAPDVTAAVVEMLHRASPLPVPTRFAGSLKFTEIWLVTKDGRFQLDALTEGQN
jgi:TonB family protein